MPFVTDVGWSKMYAIQNVQNKSYVMIAGESVAL